MKISMILLFFSCIPDHPKYSHDIRLKISRTLKEHEKHYTVTNKYLSLGSRFLDHGSGHLIFFIVIFMTLAAYEFYANLVSCFSTTEF
jgi:hypothetical protein